MYVCHLPPLGSRTKYSHSLDEPALAEALELPRYALVVGGVRPKGHDHLPALRARQASETMPSDACQFFYVCRGCGEMLRPREGDCCVFCSYARQALPAAATGG